MIQFQFKIFIFVLFVFEYSFSFANTEFEGTHFIDSKKIKKISYMMASAHGSGQSAFGHSYLLLKSNENVSPDDLVIEFVAGVEPSEINYLKGTGVLPFSSYKRIVVLEKFNVVKKDITIMQNRDLDIYDLKLNSYQKSEIIDKINKLLSSGSMGQYSFLNSNCADAVSKVLSSIGIRLVGLSSKIPNELPNELNEKGLIEKRVTILSIEHSRADLVVRYSDKLKAIRIPKYYRTMDKMFDDASLLQQLFNLLLVNQKSQDSSEFNSFVSDYWLTLTAVMKRQFKNLLPIPIGSLRLNFKNTNPTAKEYIVRESKIECNDRNCNLIVFYSNNDERKDFLKSSYPLVDFEVKGDQIYLGNLLVGVRFETKTIFSEDATLLFAATPVVSKYHIGNEEFIDIGLIIETQLNESIKKRDIQVGHDVITQSNTDPIHPMCFTILHFQQAIFERVIFAPHLHKLKREENINILKNLLLSGGIAVIPGYDNAHEFSKSINEVDFINEIYPIQLEKYSGIWNGMSEWFNLEKLSHETLKAMFIVTHNFHLSVPVIFRKNNNSMESISHSILITDMREQNGVYVLSGYDPNYTYTSEIGTLDKNTMIMHSISYGDIDIFVEKKFNLRESLLNLQIINNTKIAELLIRQSSQLKKYFFSTDEVFMMQ